MRCSVCHQDYKQSDIVDNYFVKDTTEATSTSDEKAAQVRQNGLPFGQDVLYTSVSTSMLCHVGSALLLEGSQHDLGILIP